MNQRNRVFDEALTTLGLLALIVVLIFMPDFFALNG